MHEYGITHKYCGMFTVIYGYDFYEACRWAKKDPNLWKIEYSVRID